MERKNIVAIASILLLAGFALIGMDEEDDLQKALLLSQEFEKKELEKILKPGMHKQYVDIHQTFLPQLEKEETAIPFEVYQIAVKNPQTSENVSCGPRALFIAHAIDALHKNKRPIATNTIENILSKEDHFTKAIEQCTVQLESDDLPVFIKKNNLDIAQYFVMGRIVTKEGLYPIISYVPPHNPEKPLEFDIRLKILGQELDAGRVRHPIHFIFSDTTKTHWVLVSVIKGERSDPIVYYIDPKNVDVQKYPVAHNYIEYVVDKLDLPFPKDKK